MVGSERQQALESRYITEVEDDVAGGIEKPPEPVAVAERARRMLAAYVRQVVRIGGGVLHERQHIACGGPQSAGGTAPAAVVDGYRPALAVPDGRAVRRVEPAAGHPGRVQHQ